MNKIINRIHLLLFYGLIFFTIPLFSNAQDSQLNKYGLLVIGDSRQFQLSIADKPGKAMCDLKKNIPGLRLDLRYATSNNFLHFPLYPALSTTWLRRQAADSLAVIQTLLRKKGLALKIFDAYRPYSVTERMWEPIKDERYVADPRKGSGHNRGIAVDLTLVDLDTGVELDMGTGFDNFSDSAHHDFARLPPEVLKNRAILRTVMETHGFKALETEWWHYSLPNSSAFELLDLEFKKLRKLKN